MNQVTGIGTFRARLSGAVVIKRDHGYDEARSAWSGEIDRYPAVIARCESAADVAVTIEFARQRDLEISVRGGFHNTAGTAICDDGVMIDLSPMCEVTVDPATRRVRVGGGATTSSTATPTSNPRCSHLTLAPAVWSEAIVELRRVARRRLPGQKGPA